MDQIPVSFALLAVIAAVFVAGAGLALFFSRAMTTQSAAFNSKIDLQTLAVDKKIEDTASKLEKKIEGLDVVAKADRVSIIGKIDSLEERNRHDHKETAEQIAQVRIAVAKLETNKQRAQRTKRK